MGLLLGPSRNPAVWFLSFDLPMPSQQIYATAGHRNMQATTARQDIRVGEKRDSVVWN